MQKYFDLLLELLRPEDDNFIIDEMKKLSAAAKKIEEKWDKNLKIAHKHGFIFDAYENLLNEEISLDEFLATWDITSTNKLHTNSESSIQILEWIIQWKNTNEDALFILDSISFASLENNDKKAIQERAKNNNCELVFC